MILCVSSKLSQQSENGIRGVVSQCEAECRFVTAQQGYHQVCTTPQKVKAIVIFGRVNNQALAKLTEEVKNRDLECPIVGVDQSAAGQDRLLEAGCTNACTEIELIHRLPKLVRKSLPVVVGSEY